MICSVVNRVSFSCVISLKKEALQRCFFVEIINKLHMCCEEKHRWYAVYVRSRFERKVHQMFQEKKIESFLPLIETCRQWSDRKKKVEEPLFKGYVFVHVSGLAEKYSILETDGVVKFVGVGRAPSVIPDREIEWIHMLMSEPGAVKGAYSAIPVGIKVQVIAGPFCGLQGIVVKEREDSCLVVYFESLMQGVRVTMRPELLKPVVD